jgi:acetyltransferase-like isoleucine patch superfamily enzyme
MPLKLGHRSYVQANQYRIHFNDGDVSTGNYTSIAYGALFLCGNSTSHACVDNPLLVSTFCFAEAFPGCDFPKGGSPGPIVIGSDCWICTDATILGGVTIGDGAIVGARAVVAKDVPPFSVVVGNPATVVRYRYDVATIMALQRIKWWDWPEAKILENISLMNNVQEFIKKFDTDKGDS